MQPTPAQEQFIRNLGALIIGSRPPPKVMAQRWIALDAAEKSRKGYEAILDRMTAEQVARAAEAAVAVRGEEAEAALWVLSLRVKFPRR